jgi:hypothetical protein
VDLSKRLLKAALSLSRLPAGFKGRISLHVDGVAYRAGKSDTPPRHRRRRVAISISLRAGLGKFRRSARALALAVGEGDFDDRLVQREFRFYCGAISTTTTGRPFNDVKYSLGLFNGVPSYFTGSEDIEIRG